MSNLLPQKEKVSILRLYRKRFLSLVFFSIMGLALVGCVLLFPSIYALKQNEAVLTAKRDTLTETDTTKIAASLASTVADINGRLAVFSNTATASPLLAQLIDPVLKLKTNAVHITSFTYVLADGGAIDVQVSGTTDSRADLLSFADALKTTPGFTNVDVPIESFIKDSNVTFTISATLSPTPAS